MWIIVFFDLPTDTKKGEKRTTPIFAKDSPGRRLCNDAILRLLSPLRQQREMPPSTWNGCGKSVPPDGEVRLMQFTDKQFERMEIFLGKRRTKTEKAPAQLEMF